MNVEERDSMTYRRNETTIEGECESMYTVIPDIKCNSVKSTEGRHLEPKDKGQCVQVTKSVNFDICTKRPDLRYNHYRGEQLETVTDFERKEQRGLEQSTLAQIELKKDEGKYVLRFARTISHQTLHLTKNTAMMAVSVSELQLKAVKKPTQNNAEVQSKKSATSLMHSLEFDDMLEEFVINGNEDYIEQQPYLTERNIPDVLVNIGKRMAQSFIGNAQDEWSMNSDSIAHQFVNFVKILRHATQKDLEKAEERLFQKDDEIPSAQQKSTVERLYTDALALAATQPTIRRLLEKIDSKQMTERYASSALQKLARNVQVIGKDTLNSIFQLCQKMEVSSNMQHACVLSWSRMANTMCGRNGKREQGLKIGDEWVQDKKGEPRCNEATKDALVKNAQQLYDSAGEDPQQRILALKAFGNMGLDSSIQKLEQLINDRSLPRLERITAIDALRQMVTQIPHKIRRVLMSVFVDKREHPEIRMNAIHLILKTQPDQATISQIGMETLRESNMNVRTFVIEELKGAAYQMQKISPKSAQQMRNALQLFKLSSVEQEEQMRRSGSRFETMMMNEQILSFARIYSNDSGLPKELMAQLDASFLEHFIPNFAQIGMHQQNADQVISKLFDHIGSHTVDEILVRGRRSTMQRMAADPIQTMKQMFERLRIVARRQQNVESQLMFYQREKNMDTWFVLLDEKHMPESLKQLFVDGQLDMSILETQGTQQLKSVDANFIFEAKVKVPTIFGVPVVSTSRMTKVSVMQGSMTTELNGQGKYISSGRFSIKTTPKVSLKMVQKIEAFSPLFTAGVQLQHNVDGQIPFAMEASFSSAEGIVVDFKLPDNADRVYKLLSISSHPSTLYREWPQKSRVYIEHEERTLYLPQLQDSFTQIDKEMNCPLSQVKLEVRGHYHRASQDQGLYLGENVLEIHAHVNEQTAKIVRFQLRVGSKPAGGQSLEMNRLMRIFDDKRKPLFKDNTKPEEVKMLQEYMQRHESHANSLYELDVKLMALTSKTDKSPQGQIEVMVKGLCDRDLKMCSKEMHVEVKGKQMATYMGDENWSAHVIANVARPTVTGLHGSVKSEHVLAHAEAQFGGKTDKNTLTFCAYGRPSPMQVEQWNEVKNMKSATRRSQSDQFESMDDGEYDQMVMKQMPSRLNANSYTFLTEHQLTPRTMKIARPYLQYAMLATKKHNPTEMFMWAFVQRDVQDETPMGDLHGQMKVDMTIDAGIINFRMNDISHSQRLPGWSNRRSMSMIDDEDSQYHQQLFNQKRDQDQEIGNENQRKNGENKENELPSRQSFGQRQAMRRFGADSQSGNNAKCVIDSQFNVESFDGKKYKIPMSTCYTVLAKDCSSSSSPKFAVLAKKQSETNSDLKIKLLIPKKQFELYEERKGEMIIKMDGVRLRETEYEQNGIHKITETRRPIFVLHCSVTGMELRFDGRTTMVSISDEYINKQCGVCGHYNLDSEDTLRKEDNTLASNLKEFHSSYLYRGEDNNEECTPEARKQFDDMKEEEYYKKSSSAESSSEEHSVDIGKKDERKQKVQNAQSQEQTEKKKSNKGKKHRKNGQNKEQKTKYELESAEDESKEFDREYKKIDPIPMTYIVEEQDIICFSKKPQMNCPKGSYPIIQEYGSQRQSSDENSSSQQDSEVDFVCKSRQNADARKLFRKSRNQNVIEELKEMESNKKMPVPQIKRCSKNGGSKTMSADY